MIPPFLFLFLFSLSRHSIHFNRGTLSNAVEFRFEEYADPSDGNFRILPNVVSPYILLTPVENFAAAGQTATIVIDIDNTAPNSTSIYRANPGSDWNFVNLTTEVRDGNAYAQTDQGGAFVAAFATAPTVATAPPLATSASGRNTLGITLGVSFGVIILIVVACGAAVGVYFAVRPEKWRKTKDNIRKTKTKFSRNFAKRV